MWGFLYGDERIIVFDLENFGITESCIFLNRFNTHRIKKTVLEIYNEIEED
jgi:hypothetical protein